MENTMKIIHTSDLHLESSMAKLTPQKAKERRLELVDTFHRMVREASSIGCEVFIIAGDLFDNDRYSRRAADKVASIIESYPEITFLYLIGNHESASFSERVTELPKNLKIFGDDWTYFDFGEVTFAGRTTMPPDMFSSLRLDEGRKNIVVLHGAVKESVGDSEGISLPDARARGINYLALGHYHSYTKYEIDRRGVAVYSGVPEGRGFDEAGECGFVLINTDGDEITHRFCPFAKRAIRIIEVDLTDMETPREVDMAIEDALAPVSSNDIVRLSLTGRRAPTLYPNLDGAAMRYRERFYYFEAEDESKTRINPEDYRYDKSIEGEFIRLVYSKEDLTDEEKEQIIRCGIAAMLGDRSGI